MSRGRTIAGLGLLALAAGGGAVALILTSHHVPNRTDEITLTLLLGWSFAGAGLIAWWRRPGNRFAHLMVATGFLWFLGALTTADDPGVFSAGVLLADVATPVFVQAVLSFPDGRLRSRLARGLVAATWAIVLVGKLVWLPFDDLAHACAGGCPRNLLFVTSRPDIVQAVSSAENWAGVTVGVGVVYVLARRYREASAPRRRVLLPMITAAALSAGFFVAQLVSSELSQVGVADAIHWGTVISLSIVPFAFLFGLLRTKLAGLAVGQLVVHLGRGVAPGALRHELAGALGDPSLAVAYWLPAAGGWVDGDGTRVELPAASARRHATEIEHEGRRVAALVHDASLLDEPERLDAVGAAAALSLANERLQAELRAHVSDLEHERDFSHAVLDTVPSLLVVLDTAGRIVEFNGACERLSGYAADEVRGRPVRDFIVDDEEREAVLAAIRPDALPNENENFWTTRSGERRLILWRNTALRTRDGEVEFVVCGGLDITERKAQEAEVKAQRARIVEAADGERRRLERNLHDGAQQRLVSLSLTLRLARSRLRTDPEGAEELVDAASEELAQALAELRELARGIHPAILTDRGLTPALDALVQRTPLVIDVTAEIAERLPGPVEVAAYYVVSESLANAAKYAQASGVEVTIRRVNGQAIVEVRDDGVGGADATTGTGLLGLRDRVEALGGVLVVESLAGAGTTVRAELPCGS